jgi:hypothetical protein
LEFGFRRVRRRDSSENLSIPKPFMANRRRRREVVDTHKTLAAPPSQELPYRLAVGGALSAIAMACTFPVQSDDIFMYLAIGRRFFNDGRLPRIDPFLFSLPDYHWHITHEWM